MSTSDNFHAGELAVEKLVEKGCHKLGYVGTHSRFPSETTKRRDGFEAQAGLMGVLMPSTMGKTQFWNSSRRSEPFSKKIRMWMASLPTQIYCFGHSGSFGGNESQSAGRGADHRVRWHQDGSRAQTDRIDNQTACGFDGQSRSRKIIQVIDGEPSKRRSLCQSLRRRTDDEK